jgi:hypothetical protein
MPGSTYSSSRAARCRRMLEERQSVVGWLGSEDSNESPKAPQASPALVRAPPLRKGARVWLEGVALAFLVKDLEAFARAPARRRVS